VGLVQGKLLKILPLLGFLQIHFHQIHL